MSELENQLEQIKAALAGLRATAADGGATRNQLDSLFRRVHSLKAAASADGLNDLSHAANELENVLHELRTGKATLDGNVLQQLTKTSAALSDNLLPREIWSSLKAEEKHAFKQCVKEGANLFLVQMSFDLADFDQQFPKLKERLRRNGEVISTSPRADGEKIIFRVLYASNGEVDEILQALPDVSEVKVEALLTQAASSFDAVLKRVVRGGQATAVALAKEVDFEVRGADLSVEKSLCNAIAAPLMHLVRNAVDHGIESADERVQLGKNQHGKITIEAVTSGDELTITVSDDGGGIDPSIIPLIFQPGFSTRNEVSELSGRGVGLDAVKNTLEELGGSISVSTELNEGSTFTIRIFNPR